METHLECKDTEHPYSQVQVQDSDTSWDNIITSARCLDVSLNLPDE